MGCIFNILVKFIFGFDLNDEFKELLLFPTEIQKTLYKNSTVHEIFKYIGVFIFSCFLYIIETKSNKKKMISHRLSSSSDKTDSQIILIFNDLKDENSDISILNILFIITVFVCIEYLSDIVSKLNLIIFNYWQFELLIISYINSKMFKLKIYRHQMFAICFNSFICLLSRLSYFFLSLSLKDKGSEKNGEDLFEISGWFIALGIIIYIIIITVRAYSYTKLKWFIDLKFISSTKLLICIGFIGILVTSISCIIETHLECNPKLNGCKVLDTNNSSKYIDSFIIYKNNLSNINNSKDIIIEICVIILGMICKFFALYFDMQIIKKLTPVHFIFYSSAYYFIIKIIALFYNKIINSHFFNGKQENDLKSLYKFIFDFSGNFISIFGFLIYLEIIELGFCKLNYDLRKYIEKRSIDDIRQSKGYDDLNDEDEESISSKKSINSELESYYE